MTLSPAPEPEVTIYTDGGADPNPGPGGWGAVLLAPGGRSRELSGGASETTNNRMELTAAIEALSALDRPCRVALYTDSRYLQRGITTWLAQWRRAGWKRKRGELKNVDLWQTLSRLVDQHHIRWHWVKGHAGTRWNERADALASAAVRAFGGGRAEPEGQTPAEVEVLLAVSCSARRGAWVAVVRENGQAHRLHDTVAGTTAPRLEILAAANVLEKLRGSGREVAMRVTSDYLRKGASLWLAGWRQNGWQTKAGAAVKNRDAWERLEAAQGRHQVRWPALATRPAELRRLEKEAKNLAAQG